MSAFEPAAPPIEIRFPDSAALWLDETLPTLEENLALDEVLLHDVDASPDRVVLRTWRPASWAVVLGRSNPVATEVHVDRCAAEGVPIVRRSSGGGTVLIGPGCLAYSLVLPLSEELRAAGVVEVTQAIMRRLAASLGAFVPGIAVRGTSDLVCGDRKFSGNSQRWLKRAVLHHGTILRELDLARIEWLLRPPSREPDYRAGRTHADFVCNLALQESLVVAAITGSWRGQPGAIAADQRQRAFELAESRYRQHAWNFER